MIDPVSYLVLTVVVIGLAQIINPHNPHMRLAWLTLPGGLLLFIAHPNAFLFSVATFAASYSIYLAALNTPKKHRSKVPYLILLMLFLPDLFNLAFTPLLWLGSAFFIIRQMITVAKAAKAGTVSHADFAPSLLIATYYFAAIPSGPVFNGGDAWSTLKQRTPPEYEGGSYKLIEGFIYLFALAGLANALNNIVVTADLPFIFGTLTLQPITSFLFLFTTFYGYSRMAEGVAQLFGFTVPQNFNHPHKAKDLSDYWKRWHASMAGFVMQYIYLPVLVATKKSQLALAAAFIFMGLWHEFSLAFFAWGAGHGVGLGVLLPWAKNNVPQPAIRYASFVWVLGLSSVAHGVWFGATL